MAASLPYRQKIISSLKSMTRIKLLNSDAGSISKSILAGCYKFGGATLLRDNGATMTSVIYIEER